MQTITETRGQCSAPISHTQRRCSCTGFVPAGHSSGAWVTCNRCFHVEGVHRIEARA